MAKKRGKKQLMLIINPDAGSPADSQARTERARQLLTEQGYQVTLELEHPKRRARRIARRAVRQGFRLVVVMGGDGTIEAAAPALVGTKTNLGILVGGTENNIARALGIPEDLEAGVRLIAAGQVRKIDAAQIKVGKKQMIFFEFAATGIIAELFPTTAALYKHDWSKVVEAANEFIRYQPPEMHLVLDGKSHIKEPSNLLTISNTPTFGTQYLVAPDASLEDGLLDINFYPHDSKIGVLAYFQEVSRGKETAQPEVEHYRARKIKVKCKPAQKVVADGILLGQGTLKARVIKQALRVITGPQLGLAQPKDTPAGNLPAPVAPTLADEPAKANRVDEHPYKPDQTE